MAPRCFDLRMELADWEVAPGQVVEAWTFNGMVPAPMMDFEVGDRVEVRVQNDLPIATDVHWHGVNVDNPNDGRAAHPGAHRTRLSHSPTPSPPMSKPWPCTTPTPTGTCCCPTGCSAPSSSATCASRGADRGARGDPCRPDGEPRDPDGAQRRRRDRVLVQRQELPRHGALHGQVGDWLVIHYYNEGMQIHPMHLHQFDQIVFSKDGYPLDNPYRVDTLNVAPGERYSVLVEIDEPGAWVWHCHILPHVESEAGMFGMVTALARRVATMAST